MDKLQRAGGDFLMRLVAKHGLRGAARVLRAWADEFSRLAKSAGIKHDRALPLIQMCRTRVDNAYTNCVPGHSDAKNSPID